MAHLRGFAESAERLELPGHGPGEDPVQVAQELAEGKHIDRLAAAIRARAGSRKTVLVGHSTGGLIAVQLAHRYPELLHSVIVVGGLTCGRRGRAFDPVARLISHPVLGPAAFRLLWRIWMSSERTFRRGFQKSGPVAPDPDLLDEVRARLVQCDPMAVRACAEWVVQSDLGDLLAEITVPVFALIGTRDNVVRPAHQLALIKAAPNAHAQLLDGGHLLWADRPAAVANAIRAWLPLPENRARQAG